MHRISFEHDGLTLSYLDAGGDGRVLIALHAHWMEGATFRPLAAALAPRWRVVALDQRGHGYSDHAPSYTRDDYLGDVAALVDHIGLKDPAVLLGNSLGGVNAYQFAAHYPNLVLAMIIEDIGAVVADDTSFALRWAGSFASKEDLMQCVGPRLQPYLQESFRQVKGRWHLAFDPRDTTASQSHLNGDHWKDWLATDCPSLIIRGRDSRVTTQSHLELMAARRPNTRLLILDGGHVVHADNPEDFVKVVKEFLDEIERSV